MNTLGHNLHYLFWVSVPVGLAMLVFIIWNDLRNKGKLLIHHAEWGVWKDWVNVTNKINAEVKNNRLNMYLSCPKPLPDPHEGQGKTLMIDYSFDGKRDTAVFEENKWAILPPLEKP
jgi:hypothetical protein